MAPLIASTSHPEDAIARDNALYLQLRKEVKIKKGAIPALVYKSWPSRKAPGPPGWKENPLLLCKPQARQLLQRLYPLTWMRPLSSCIDICDKASGHILESTDGSAKRLANCVFLEAYRSIVVELVALCIVAETDEESMSDTTLHRRLEFFDSVLSFVANNVWESKSLLRGAKHRSLPEDCYEMQRMTAITWWQTMALFQWWLLRSELRSGPRSSSYALRLLKFEVPQLPVLSALAHWPRRLEKTSDTLALNPFQEVFCNQTMIGVECETFMDKVADLALTIYGEKAAREEMLVGPFSKTTQAQINHHHSQFVRYVFAQSSGAVPAYRSIEDSMPSLRPRDALDHHEVLCSSSSCALLGWTQESLDEFFEPLAVKLDLSSEGLLQFTTCNARTLAISHAFDETVLDSFVFGIRECLHTCLSAIARRFDCDSYYLGTIFGSGDSLLTVGEYMSGQSTRIVLDSEVFERSEHILIYDKDLCLLPTPEGIRSRIENLAIVLIAGEWARSPLTRIQAAISANSMHVLCKDQDTIRLPSLIRCILDQASIEVAFMLRTNEALTKFIAIENTESISGPQRLRYEPPDLDQTLSILCHSRFRDNPEWDERLWAHLIRLTYPPPDTKGDTMVRTTYPQFYAELFWKPWNTPRGWEPFIVPARWLISATPRMGRFGFSWAPVSPLHYPLGEEFLRRGWHVYYSGPAVGGAKVEVTEAGLVGVWRCFVHPLKPPPDWVMMGQTPSSNVFLAELHRQFAPSFDKMALIQAAGQDEDCDDVHVLGYRASDGREEEDKVGEVAEMDLTGRTLRDKYRVGAMMGVLGTNNDASWLWCGVYVWDVRIPMPRFKKRKLRIV